MIITNNNLSLGGHYCPNGSETYTECEYPYYCPPGSGSPKLCDLGHSSLRTSKPRVLHKDNCQICRQGTYGNDKLRLNCTICPPGYFCPQGTIGPYQNRCPEGYYCPEGSGDKFPCPAGSYGNRSLATASSDCYKCPVNTYSNVAGSTACQPCGSSAAAGQGQDKCTCIGKFRSFQISDGSCTCLSGYVFYDETDKKEEEGNSDNDCQPEVSHYISGYSWLPVT